MRARPPDHDFYRASAHCGFDRESPTSVKLAPLTVARNLKTEGLDVGGRPGVRSSILTEGRRGGVAAPYAYVRCMFSLRLQQREFT